MEGIRSFIKIADGFFSSGQPTEEQFGEVHRSGVRLVINLAMPDSDHALPDERTTVEAHGMAYTPIPVPFSSPTVGHFLQFEERLLSNGGAPVLVHCALNWRATSFAALFAERHFGWSRARADELRGALWSPNDVWSAWASSIRVIPVDGG